MADYCLKSDFILLDSSYSDLHLDKSYVWSPPQENTLQINVVGWLPF